jgi:antitoxin (DNA-binding transcriptional repressor) of toxin-antitoxin stability system
MIKLNVHQAKTHLSRYLARLARGESILLCKRNIPIAEIRPIRARRKVKRPVGLAKVKFNIPANFLNPYLLTCSTPSMAKKGEAAFRYLYVFVDYQ